MNAKLEPRKATDRGGWLCMPLVTNGPEDAGVVKASHLDGAVCTKCALRKAGDVV